MRLKRLEAISVAVGFRHVNANSIVNLPELKCRAFQRIASYSRKSASPRPKVPTYFAQALSSAIAQRNEGSTGSALFQRVRRGPQTGLEQRLAPLGIGLSRSRLDPRSYRGGGPLRAARVEAGSGIVFERELYFLRGL